MRVKMTQTSPGGVVYITDEGGNKIDGVKSFSIKGDDRVGRLELNIVAFDADLNNVRFVMADPRDGTQRTIKRIEFEDGEPFEAPTRGE